jgi:hypothetical protein
MPNTKQFEAWDINDMLFGNNETKYLSMVEISDLFFSKIKEVYRILNEGKVAFIELPGEDCNYTITKESSYIFILSEESIVPAPFIEKNSIEIINWLFTKAPYMGMVGQSNK